MDGMVRIPGAAFLMGSDHHYPEEAPAHKVTVGGFWIDACPVTNREFGRFVRKTGYVTMAERAPDPGGLSGSPAGIAGAVLVGIRPAAAPGRPGRSVQLVEASTWAPTGGIRSVPAARSRASRTIRSCTSPGPTWPAYARWVGKEIPTEAEWELAARGGLDGAEFAWGDELNPDGSWMANTWQGEFPVQNTLDDGYERTSPVGGIPGQRLRPVRHDRQRLGVDLGLVRRPCRGPLPTAAAAGTGMAAASRASTGGIRHVSPARS